MSYDNLRKGHVSLPHHAYFVTTVTQDRRPLFTDLAMARRVIGAMRQLEQENHLNSLAWVLMPDHLHWLFQVQEGELTWIMKLFKGRSAKGVNDVSGLEGPMWQRAYYDRAVRPNEDLCVLSRYIVANPLRAGWWRRLGSIPIGMRRGCSLHCRAGFNRPMELNWYRKAGYRRPWRVNKIAGSNFECVKHSPKGVGQDARNKPALQQFSSVCSVPLWQQ